MFYELTSQPSGRGGIVSDIFDQRRTEDTIWTKLNLNQHIEMSGNFPLDI